MNPGEKMNTNLSDRQLSLLVSLFLLLPTALPAQDTDLSVTISEWTVPWPDSRPRDPDVAPDGTIWLVGQRQERNMLDVLAAYLDDDNPRIRGMAAWAIVHIAPEEFIPGTKV